MTAPDDVRARFEAWLLDREIKTPRRPNGYYQSDETCFWWRLWQDAYRAAHADLSGEVRELVEADREYDAALRGLVPAFHTTVECLNKAMERRATALAKFTQQEKP